jgi:hypothetical protein
MSELGTSQRLVTGPKTEWSWEWISLAPTSSNMLFTRTVPDGKSHVYEIPGKGSKKRFTLDEECNVYSPYASSKRQSNLIIVPNGDAGAIISFPNFEKRIQA